MQSKRNTLSKCKMGHEIVFHVIWIHLFLALHQLHIGEEMEKHLWIRGDSVILFHYMLSTFVQELNQQKCNNKISHPSAETSVLLCCSVKILYLCYGPIKSRVRQQPGGTQGLCADVLLGWHPALCEHSMTWDSHLSSAGGRNRPSSTARSRL